MNILFVHNKYRYAGGEDVVVQSEMDMLKAHGHKVIYYEQDNASYNRLTVFQKLKFFKDFFWSSRTYRDIRAIIATEHINLAHVHNTLFFVSPSVYDACYDAGIPVVQTIHNYRFICANGLFYRQGAVCEDCTQNGGWSAVLHKCVQRNHISSLMYWILLKVYRWRSVFTRKISAFIAPSQFTKNKVGQYLPIPQEKLFVKPNFVEADPGQRQSVGAYVLFVGSLWSYKGVEVLLEAWKSLPEIPLKIIGTGPLQELVKQRAQGNIEWLGAKPLGETLQIMKNAAFVVVPSLCYETFSRVIVESFACGVPVLVSNTGAMAERIEEGITGRLFQVSDPQDLRKVAKELYGNFALLERMGINARRKYEESFTKDVNHNFLMSIYEEVITKNTGKGTK